MDVLKILNFVPLPEDQPLPVALVLKASDHLTKALFSALLMLETEDPDNTCYDDLAQIIDHLHILSNSAAGLPMVMRSLLIGAMTPAISGNAISKCCLQLPISNVCLGGCTINSKTKIDIF